MKHCTKNHGIEFRASFFSAAFYTKKKCEIMSNLVLYGVRFGSVLRFRVILANISYIVIKTKYYII